jgi:hypothetical protein
MQENSVPGEKYVRNRLLADKDKVLLPPPGIKMGLMKKFLEVMKKIL